MKPQLPITTVPPSNPTEGRATFKPPDSLPVDPSATVHGTWVFGCLGWMLDSHPVLTLYECGDQVAGASKRCIGVDKGILVNNILSGGKDSTAR